MRKNVIRRTASSLAILLAAVACSGLHRAEEYLPPEFVELTAEAEENVLVLGCRIEGKGLCEAGFLLIGPSGEVVRLSADSLSVDELSSDSRLAGALSAGDRTVALFSTTVGDLAYDASYRYSAWVSNGQEVLYSEEATVHTGAMLNLPIPDPAFKEWLLGRYDWDDDGEISCREAEDIDYIDICPTNDFNLRSLKGIEYMPNLEVIRCGGEWCGKEEGKGLHPQREHYYVGPYKNRWDYCWGPIGTLEYADVTHNPKLKELVLENNSALGVNLQGLDIFNNPDLEILNLSMTWLPYPDISKNLKLKEILFSHLRGDYPDFSNRPALKILYADYPFDNKNVKTQYIDVSKSPDLEYLLVSNAAFAISDLSQNPKLRVLGLSSCNDIGAVDLHIFPDLEELHCQGLQLDSFDCSGNPRLRVIDLDSNSLTDIDLAANPLVEELRCGDNRITELDLSGCRHLRILDCSPMEMLKTLYLPAGITIPGVWPDRDTEYIPAQTEIIFK